MSHSFTNLLYHVVYATKNREPLLDEVLQVELFARLGGILETRGGVALAINGMADHVHLLVKLRPEHQVSRIVSELKAWTSGWIHRTREHLSAFAWQTGYGAFTVSQSQVPKVTRYIQNQKEHHRLNSFDNEFRALLGSHGFALDEQAYWE